MYIARALLPHAFVCVHGLSISRSRLCAKPSRLAIACEDIIWNSIQWNVRSGSTFYSIYLANCVCIRALSDVNKRTGDTVWLAASFGFCFFFTCFAFLLLLLLLLFAFNISFGSHSPVQFATEHCIECRLQTSTYWIMFNGWLFFSTLDFSIVAVAAAAGCSVHDMNQLWALL